MSTSSANSCILSAGLVCATLSWIHARRSKPLAPLPPSPKSDPLIGHMRTLMSASNEPEAYNAWGKELGSDIISLSLPPGNVLIVLNSTEVADELLAKRSSIYSDRPQAPMLSSERLVDWGNNTGVIGYGERWRIQRRMTHEVLHRKASQDIWPTVVKQSRLGLQRILDDPSNFAKDLRRMAGSSLLYTVYGYEVKSADDRLVDVVETAVVGFSQAGIVSNFFVNVIPWLQYIPEWFPGAEWKRQANVWRAEKDDMLNIPYDWTKSQLAAGKAPPSMLAQLLSKHAGEETIEEWDQMRWAAGTLFSAGTDTSVASALVFVMAMAMYPEVQAKAQAEIDSVLGGTRLPEMTDRESMPYMQCIVKEVLRWRSVLPLAIPHAPTEDDMYNGYHIPKGATIIANTWAMSRDENIYPDPEQFNPSRFLDPSVPDAPAFGFGRRGCPGLHIAQASLYIIATGILSGFNIRPAKDSAGNPIPLTGEMTTGGIVSQPLPFECDIKPRSERHERVIREWVDV